MSYYVNYMIISSSAAIVSNNSGSICPISSTKISIISDVYHLGFVLTNPQIVIISLGIGVQRGGGDGPSPSPFWPFC